MSPAKTWGTGDLAAIQVIQAIQTNGSLDLISLVFTQGLECIMHFEETARL